MSILLVHGASPASKEIFMLSWSPCHPWCLASSEKTSCHHGRLAIHGDSPAYWENPRSIMVVLPSTAYCLSSHPLRQLPIKLQVVGTVTLPSTALRQLLRKLHVVLPSTANLAGKSRSSSFGRILKSLKLWERGVARGAPPLLLFPRVPRVPGHQI